MEKITLTTKQCPNCNDIMLPLHSTDEKICASCGNVIHWPLDEGQKKVFNDKKSD